MTDEEKATDAADSMDRSAPYERRTDEQIKELAVDLHAGRIFTSQHVEVQADVTMVFMAFALSGTQYSDWLKANDIGVLYEYLDKAGPRCINGNPCFFSHHALSREDWDRVVSKADDIKAALEDV